MVGCKKVPPHLVARRRSMRWEDMPSGDFHRAMERWTGMLGPDASLIFDMINDQESTFVYELTIFCQRTRLAPRSERKVTALGMIVPLSEMNRRLCLRALERSEGNKAAAARSMGISRRAFYRMLERHGLHERVLREKASGD